MGSIDPAFKSVDRNKPCFLIWRIENMNVIAVPKTEYGKFFKGDSYIVLSIMDKKGSLDAHIHFWLGKETTQDEAGVAAYKSVELDDLLGGYPVQHRELQECESKLFLSYFKKGIKYINGGVKSGFNHVDTTINHRLLQVKGKHNVRVLEVDIDWSSFNSGDVFLLDLGQIIFVWMGQGSSRTERRKGLELASAFRADRGSANIVDVMEGEEDKMTNSEKQVWNEKLPLSEKTVKTKEEGGADEAYEKEAVGGLKLYRCAEEEGVLKVSEVKSGPLDRKDLDSGDSFILQDGDRAIWVWTGKQSSKKEKSEAMRNGLGFIKKKGLPNAVNVTRVVEGGEPVDFICLFKRWPQPVATGKVYKNNRIAKTVQTKFDASTLHSNRALAAETQMVDDGSGTAEIWRVKDFDLVPVEKKYIGQFFGGDCYVILYTYELSNRKHYIIYYWQGLKSTTDERGTSALKAVELDDSLGGAAVQIRVVQGKEPQHFLAMFDGKMVIFSGGHAGWSGESSDGPGDSYMLQVQGSSDLGTKAVQVPMEAASLNTNDVFVVFTRTAVYLWFGKGCTGDEREAGKKVAQRSPRESIVVSEGQEKADFWNAIGGKGEYFSDKRFREDNMERPARLFQISNASGKMQVEEIINFTQQDCVSDDCMMLDAWHSIYVWIGKDARPEEKKEAERIALEYLKSDPTERDPDTLVCKIKQGYEPPTFTGFFGVWDSSLFEKDKSYSQYAKELAADNSELIVIKELENIRLLNQTANGINSVDETPKYKLEQLKVSPDELPGGVDPMMKEMYLSAEDFTNVFGMSHSDFLCKPAWKQQEMKKKVGLF